MRCTRALLRRVSLGLSSLERRGGPRIPSLYRREALRVSRLQPVEQGRTARLLELAARPFGKILTSAEFRLHARMRTKLNQFAQELAGEADYNPPPLFCCGGTQSELCSGNWVQSSSVLWELERLRCLRSPA